MKDTNLIIGKKNTGKTRNVLFNEVKDSIKNNENLCIFNTRDEYYRTFAKELKENDYNVLVLNLSDATKSNGYNPLLVPYLLYKKGNLDLSISMVNNLALEIFKEDNSNSDPFWANMASNYFTGLVSILFKEAKIEEINLGSVQIMMSQGEENIGETTYLKKYLENVDVTNVIYTLLSPIVFAPFETKGSIISVAKQKLNVYMLREQLLNLLNTNEINLKELSSKVAIFIIGKDGINDIANIFLNQIIEVSNISFTYILDNFDELRKLMSFDNLIKNASYTGNKVYVAIHNEKELIEKYGKYIVDNFDTITDMNTDVNTIFEASELGNNTDYPILSMNKHSYMNFKNLIDEKYNLS